jgi:heat shock protein HtpX
MVIDILFYNAVFSRRNRDDGNNKLLIVIILLRYILPVLTVLLMLYLSRTREYMADAGCVELMRDNEPLGRALLKIHEDTVSNAATYDQAYNATAHENVRRAAYLYDPAQAGIDRPRTVNELFSTHPDLENRLAAIGFKLKDSSTM